MVELVVRMYKSLFPGSWVILGIGVVVLGPLALFRVTRPWAGLDLFLGSFVIGLTTWLLGSAGTLEIYGLVVAIIGWLILGVGVVPIAIFASFFTLGYPAMGWSLIVMPIVTSAFRSIGSALSES